MPKTISGLRFARSFLTPAGAAVSREIDFQLGSRQGIAIHHVSGGMTIDAVTETTDTLELRGNHTLHLETGSLESVPDAGAEDEDTIDSEVFFRQDFSCLIQEEAATRGGSHSSLMVSPASQSPLVIPVFTARNITHRGISSTASFSMHANVLIHYTFVEFSLSELGVLLARRA